MNQRITGEEPARKGLAGKQLEAARQIVEELRARLSQAAAGDEHLLFALRRYVWKRLEFDERGRPADRKKIKFAKIIEQKGACAICGEDLPKRGAELDRFHSEKGYTEENTRLVCHNCHREQQQARNFS